MMDTLRDELFRIDGFNAADALLHVGDSEAALAEVLAIFCAEFDEQLAALNDALEQEDWKGYTIRIHGLKGSFANIGAQTLSAWARELEMASKEGNTQLCKEQTADICKAMKAMRDALLETSIFKDKPEPEKTQVEAAFVLEQLPALEAACRSGLSNDAEAAADMLKGMFVNEATGPILSAICSLVFTMDYAPALVKIRELRDILSK
jgi:HPt (histidine-containing phosphotransfer) domain-containing protein